MKCQCGRELFSRSEEDAKACATCYGGQPPALPRSLRGIPIIMPLLPRRRSVGIFSEALMKGREDGGQGKPPSDNPFNDDGNSARLSWMAGWEIGHKELQKRLATSPSETPAQ